MNLWNLKDIYIGEPDGKKEAAYRSDFDEFFFNYGSIYEKALEQKYFLIVGSKGSGKSLLAELIKKKENQIESHFCEIISYKKLKYQELVHFSNGDVAPNQYTSILEWSLLVEISKALISNTNLCSLPQYHQLQQFFSDNGFELDITADRVLAITKERSISAKALISNFFGGEASKKQTTQLAHGNYIQYISALKKTVMEIIELSWDTFTIILDELDDRYRDNETCNDSLISLIKVVDEYNLEFVRLRTNNKIVVLLRNDILSKLTDSDLNKVKQGNSITLNWGTHNDSTSPIFDLLFQKIRTSVPLVAAYTRTQLFDLFLMKDNGHNRTSLSWLLSRTLLRPRDIINFLRIIQRENPSASSFEYSDFNRLEKTYSQCFLQEREDELSGHLEKEVIDVFFKLLKSVGKKEFTYSEISTVKNSHPRFSKIVSLDDLLEQMFEFNVIGNRNEITNRVDWHYRDDEAYFKDEEIIVVHAGLRKALSL